MNEVAHDYTTTRQNAHSTEAIVRYQWHPWFGRTVHVQRLVRKKSQVMLYAACQNEQAARLREIPEWMVDSATCARMKSAREPVVACEALIALRELIGHLTDQATIDVRGGACVSKEHLIKEQHLEFPQPSLPGDADATTDFPLPSSCSTQPVSSPAETSSVGEVACGSAAGRNTAAGAVSEKPSFDTQDSQGGE